MVLRTTAVDNSKDSATRRNKGRPSLDQLARTGHCVDISPAKRLYSMHACSCMQSELTNFSPVSRDATAPLIALHGIRRPQLVFKAAKHPNKARHARRTLTVAAEPNPESQPYRSGKVYHKQHWHHSHTTLMPRIKLRGLNLPPPGLWTSVSLVCEVKQKHLTGEHNCLTISSAEVYSI